MNTCFSLSAFLYSALCTITPISAQEIQTNMELFQNLGTKCLESIPAKADSILIDPPIKLPYLTSHLIQDWQEQDVVLFSYDSTKTSSANYHLSWDVTDSSISYNRESRKNFSRIATLAMRYTLVNLHGEFIAYDTCHKSFTDIIPKSIISEVESEIFPETQGEVPADQWVRRHLEPIIIAAATALASFLFFNLRNNSADS